MNPSYGSEMEREALAGGFFELVLVGGVQVIVLQTAHEGQIEVLVAADSMKMGVRRRT